MESSMGKKLRDTLKEEKPLQVMGAMNAYTAMMAKKTGYRSLYLSGAGVANASYGLPDLGITSLNDVLIDVERITTAVDLPLLVDIDTGWGGAFNIAKTIKQMIRYQAAAVHIEDQVSQKRCGHRPNKEIVPTAEMEDRIKAAVDAKTDANFVIMARTDAFADLGLNAALDRAQKYVEAGADMIFAEALTELDQYKKFSSALKVPILANITEFGKTPLFTVKELESAGVSLVLYPLSAFRAMNAAALEIYTGIRKEGTQKNLLHKMQNREELYQFLNYYSYEEKLDHLYSQKKS